MTKIAIMKPQIIVPEFSSNDGVSANLTKKSWENIFYFADAQQEPQKRFWRKVVKVRIASKDALYISQACLHGIYNNSWYRRIYGEVLFHTRHDFDKTIPYQSLTQLIVLPCVVHYNGYIQSVRMYMLENTRLSEETYLFSTKEFVKNGKCELTDKDRAYGLLKTEKMLEFNYAPPPMEEI